MRIDEKDDLIEKPSNLVKNQAERPGILANKIELMSSTKMTSGGSKIALELGGCKSCPFIGTNSCPYFPSVTRENIHPDGYCEKFKKTIQAVTSGNYVGITKQKQNFNVIKAQLVFDSIFDKWAKNPEKIPKEMLAWYVALQDDISKIRKQEEGSKLAVAKELSPSQVIEAIRKAEQKVITAEFEEIKEEDD